MQSTLPYTASLRELKNDTQSVFFNEPTPYTATLRELKHDTYNVFLPNLLPIRPTSVI